MKINSLCAKKINIALFMVLFLLIILLPQFAVAAGTVDKTFTFNIKNFPQGNGQVNYGSAARTTWTEGLGKEDTLNISVKGNGYGEVYGAGTGMISAQNGSDGWVAVNSGNASTISVTFSMPEGYLFNLKSVDLFDVLNHEYDRQSTYSLVTSKGGIEVGCVPINNDGSKFKHISYSDNDAYNGISSFTISLTANGGKQTGIAIANLVLTNIEWHSH